MAAVFELVCWFHVAIPDLDLFALHLKSQSKAEPIPLVLHLFFHLSTSQWRSFLFHLLSLSRISRPLLRLVCTGTKSRKLIREHVHLDRKKKAQKLPQQINWQFFFLSPESVDNVNWLPLSFNADVSSVSPSSERMEELWVVCVSMKKMELRYWWEHGDEKNMNKLVEQKRSLRSSGLRVSIWEIKFCYNQHALECVDM